MTETTRIELINKINGMSNQQDIFKLMEEVIAKEIPEFRYDEYHILAEEFLNTNPDFSAVLLAADSRMNLLGSIEKRYGE